MFLKVMFVWRIRSDRLLSFEKDFFSARAPLTDEEMARETGNTMKRLREVKVKIVAPFSVRDVATLNETETAKVVG